MAESAELGMNPSGPDSGNEGSIVLSGLGGRVPAVRQVHRPRANARAIED